MFKTLLQKCLPGKTIQLLTALILCCLVPVFAQESVTVTGTVTDETGMPMPAVSVKIKGTSQAVSTSSKGAYSIKANIGATLVFQYLSYATQEAVVNKPGAINIKLVESNNKLEEVVVIGYGTQKRSNTTGSIAKISAESIEERPITRVEQALQGQMAGVTVRATSGAPGSDINIQVRGTASITGLSTPLYVVDGVPLDNLSGINPSDIQSIDVLKDASSAAIYGSRGSNGVVLVTTKKGKTGAPVFNVSSYTAIANAERKVKVMTSDEWIDFNKKWLDRQWTVATGQPSTTSQADRIAYAQKINPTANYTTRDGLLGIRGTYGIYDPYWGTSAIEPIDWQDELFRNAPVQDVQLSASGATDKINYSLSGGIFKQKGLVEGTSFDRYSFRSNIEAQVSKSVKVGLSIAPSVGITKGANVDGKDNAVSRALSFPGWVLAGTGNMAGAQPTKFYDGWGPGANNVSPYVQAVYNDRLVRDTRLNTSLTTTVNIIEGLTANALVGWNYRGNTLRTYSPTWIQGNWDASTTTPGSLSTSRRTTLSNNNLLTQGTLSYVKTIGKHNFDVLLGASREKFTEENTDQAQNGFPNDKTWVFDQTRGTTTINTITGSSNALLSGFGRFQYNYAGKYLLAASIRRDGSSKFGPESRWGWFPAVSAGWNASEETFIKNINWISTAKVRLSWGQTGNDRISNSNTYSLLSGANYPYGDSQANNAGFATSSAGNLDLRWEKSDSYNFGVDLGILKNRISISADVYYKKTTDLLLNGPISLLTGFSTLVDNVGSVDNKGFEFTLNTNNTTGTFKWNTSMNISVNRNKITGLTGDNADIKLGQGNTIIQRVGSPINSYYLLDATGVLRESDFTIAGTTFTPKVPIFSGQKPGDTKYRDANGDGKIDANDYVVAGSYQPKFEFGFTNNFYYKNWDASILVQGRVGGDLLSIGSRGWNRATNDTRYNYMESWLNNAYWSESDPGDGKVPAFFSSVTSQYDTNWLYSATYLRIKNISVGYNIPVKKSIMSRLRVYASLDNVYMWDSYYPGYSPEAATQDNASSDWGSYPQARTISLGLTATF